MRGTSPQQTDAKPSLFARVRARYSWLDHLVRAGQSYTANHGDHYAAAITFFSVLSLVPLLMIAFAVAGFVLAGNPELLQQLLNQIHSAAPPGLDKTLDPVIAGAIRSRGSVGIVGLLGALYSGLGWMGNLRDALTAQWHATQGQATQGQATQGQATQGQATQGQATQGQATQGQATQGQATQGQATQGQATRGRSTHEEDEQPPESAGFLRTKVFDLLALLGLGLALMASFALTGIGTAFASVVLDALGLGQIPGARLVLVVLAVAASVAGMWLVFLWVIARLPRQRVPLRSATRAAWFGAIGFELLKQAFAIYLDSVTNSPTGRLFGPVIGLMVFAYFVSRFLLFLTAWAAVVAKDQPPVDLPPTEIDSGASVPEVVVGSRPDATR